MLYIVATPIGNLKDITLRALDVLKSVDLIACEDSRHTRILLEHYGIKAATTSFFSHNRLTKADYLIKFLKKGKDIALVSDAGTPGILDPGYNIINLAIKNNIGLTFIPGATAFVAALVLSGKPAHKFIFEGFLPVRQIARKNRMKKLAGAGCTIIFYESCHRILATLTDAAEVFPDRELVCVREITKKFEDIRRGSAKQIRDSFQQGRPKGEFTVVV